VADKHRVAVPDTVAHVVGVKLPEAVADTHAEAEAVAAEEAEALPQLDSDAEADAVKQALPDPLGLIEEETVGQAEDVLLPLGLRLGEPDADSVVLAHWETDAV
jgi:hypothetical protein